MSYFSWNCGVGKTPATYTPPTPTQYLLVKHRYLETKLVNILVGKICLCNLIPEKSIPYGN